MAIKETGYLTYDELSSIQTLPSEERYKKGAVAVIECIQNIPCNPCESACPVHAITVGDPIINLPALDAEKCIGCGKCVASCPGLAIFLVNKGFSENTATVSFPYEYKPTPDEGMEVNAVNRQGEVLCKGKVVKVMNPAAYDHTPVVTVEIPKEFADEVRSIERLKKGE